MAKLHGKEARIFNGAQEIISARTIDVDVKSDTVDATDHDSAGWHEKLYGNKTWTGQTDHAFVLADVSQDALFTALSGATILTIKVYPNGTGSGKPEYTGTALVTDYKYNAPNADIQTLAITLEGTGALTHDLQP